ncbi:hypothetical protein Hanom_Chr14g01246671 [Helianthus anomalus]
MYAFQTKMQTWDTIAGGDSEVHFSFKLVSFILYSGYNMEYFNRTR